MAMKLPNFLKAFTGGGAKSRVFLVIVAVAAVGIAIFFGARFLQGGATTVGPSRVAQAPAGLQSVPGGKVSPEFYRAVEQANAQAAQQAQITGGTAVPTLLNVPAENTGKCCNPDNVDVADQVNDFVKSGKLSQDDADKLNALSKKNVTVDEYAAALNDLVKQGKLSPEDARRLLAAYTKQHGNQLAVQSASAMDALVKSGQLPLGAANELIDLQKKGLSPAEYAQELNRLVQEGKISPEVAAKLLAQYTQQHAQEQTNADVFGLQELAKEGKISQDAADALSDLQKRNASVDDYAATLNRLVAQGKLTPEMAAKLLAQYKAQHGLTGETPVMKEVVAQVTSQLPPDCPAILDGLAKGKKLTADEMKKFAACQKLADVHKEIQKLIDLQNKKSTLEAYLEELKRAIKAGLFTPTQAAKLLGEYKSTLAIKPGGPVTLPLANAPGAAGLAKLEAQLQVPQEAAPTEAAETTQLQAASQQANAQEEQERRQRIQNMMDAMSTQAQQLVTAWQPVSMKHEETPPEVPANKLGKEGSQEGPTTRPGEGGSSGGQGEQAANPIIKAGTIIFAVLDTAVNSDFPDSPVMATVISGQFKGAKLIGKLAVASGSAVQQLNQDKVNLTFNLMNMDAWPKSKTINAFGIDPDTARSAIASSVDYHYLKRYGALLASSFLSGYAQAIQTAGSTTTISTTGTTTTVPPLSPRDKFAIGLGKVGSTLSTAVQNNVNIPPTVIVNSGVGLGILFMADVS